MFELNTKNLLIAGASALAVTAVIVGGVVWFSKSSWDKEAADKAHSSMIDAYNAATSEFPTDHNKASFAFEVAASEIRKTFIEKNSKFEVELNEWLERYDEEVKNMKKVIRKV